MEKVLETIIRYLPYPDQIRDIKIGADEVRFTWRRARYRVSESLFVEEVQDGCLAGTDITILMRALLTSHAP